jgi:hypothetical protein
MAGGDRNLANRLVGVASAVYNFAPSHHVAIAGAFAVLLTHLDPVRDGEKLIGWTARFIDPNGLVRIATLGLHCVMDPSAFAKAVAAQGIPYRPPAGAEKVAWQRVVHELRRR